MQHGENTALEELTCASPLALPLILRHECQAQCVTTCTEDLHYQSCRWVSVCVQRHGAELIRQSVDLLGWAVSALDGEKDPRCLLSGLQSVRELCTLYATHSPEVCPKY